MDYEEDYTEDGLEGYLPESSRVSRHIPFPNRTKETTNDHYDYGITCHKEPLDKLEKELQSAYGSRLEPIRAPLSARQKCKSRIKDTVSPVNNLLYYGGPHKTSHTRS